MFFISPHFLGGTKMEYTNSSLVNCTIKSPNHSGARTHTIDRITPHCVVGQLSAEGIGSCFTSTSSKSSCNYGIGTDGRVCLIVDEKNRSWCSSSNENDQRAVTIECASGMSEPYTMNRKVYNKLIKLCTDICKRYGKKKLLWFNSKSKSLNYNPKPDEMILTVHRWFANKSCPGDWLYNRLGKVATKVTKALGGSSTTKPTTTNNSTFKPYKVKITANVLNIRKGAGTNYSINGTVKKNEIYTIIGEKKGTGAKKWLKLKSGAGYIASNYTKKA